MTRTIKATTIAWVTSAHTLHMVGGGFEDSKVIGVMGFSDLESMGDGAYPWYRVGVARIEVDVFDEKTIVVSAVETLRNEQRNVRAEAEERAIDIERRIQQLLAITNDPSEVPS